MIKQGIKQLNLNAEQVTKWEEKDLFKLSAYLRKITKPMIIAANKIDIPGAIDNYNNLRDQFPNHVIIPCSAESELALKEAAKHQLINYIPGEKDFSITEQGETKLNDKQKTALNFIKENILGVYTEGTGVQSILNNVVFDILKYIAIHPGGVNKLEDQNGNVLPDCFLMKQGSTALDFAYAIHTQVGYSAIGSQINGRAASLDTELKTGDIVEIKTQRNKKYPNVKSLQYVKSRRARTKIYQGLTKAKNEKLL
jgi:ribosome-binding ATPase YchF (GTP1/OBG family)